MWGDDDPAIAPNYLNYTPQEIQNQSLIRTYITSLFQTCGYSAGNYEGSGTTPSNILSLTSYWSQIYRSVSTIQFDHGIELDNSVSQSVLNQIPNWQSYPSEFHFMLCGSNAVENNPINDVFDYQIYSATSNENNYFSFISACLSADLAISNGYGFTVAMALILVLAGLVLLSVCLMLGHMNLRRYLRLRILLLAI